MSLLCVCVCVLVWRGRWSTASSTAHREASALLSPTTCTAAWRTWCSTITTLPWCSTTTRSTSASLTPSTHRCPRDTDEPPPIHTHPHTSLLTLQQRRVTHAPPALGGGRKEWRWGGSVEVQIISSTAVKKKKRKKHFAATHTSATFGGISIFYLNILRGHSF